MKRPTLLMFVAAGMISLAASGPASAQQPAEAKAAGSIEEVVVTTARYRTESLQDVPATITAITSDVLESADVSRAADFVRLTPGVSLVQAAEVADAQVNIRGINGARDAENSFALLVDGILMTNPAAFNREYEDLQQIEVLKGPNGALYGRNAAAGAIIITTTKPTEEFSGRAKVGYGEDKTYTGALVMSGPLSAGARWKLAADYRKTDGFYNNIFVNRKNVDDYKGWNVNGRLLFDVGESGKLDVKAHYGKVDGASITFNAAFALPAFTGAPLPNAPLFWEDVNQHNFTFVNNIDPSNEQKAGDISVKYDTDVGIGRLTAWALYSDVKNSFGADGTSGSFNFFNADAQCQSTAAQVFNSTFLGAVGQPGHLPPPQIIFFGAPGVPPAAIFGPYTPTACDGTQWQERNQKDYSFEARLASKGEGAFNWLAGVYYLNIDREVGVNLGIDRGQGILPQLFNPAGSANPTESLAWDRFKSDVYAGFGQLSYKPTDALELALAARYDSEERKVHNLVPTAARTQYIDFNPFDGVFTGGAPLNAGLNPLINPAGTIPDRKRTFSQFQPKVSVTWKPRSTLSLFANWGVGFKSGGFNSQGSAATTDLFINCLTQGGCTSTSITPTARSVIVRDQFDKEKSTSAEVGLKSALFDNRLQLDVSLYTTKVDNMQFFEFLVGPFGLLRIVNNIDEVHIDGAEISANARLTNHLRLVAGYSRVDSEIRKFTSRPYTVGNRSPYTPGYTATAGAEFDFPLDNAWRWQASAYWNQTGPTWFHAVQDEQVKSLFGVPADYTRAQREAFDTIDARLAVGNDHLTVALVGKNITDEHWLQEVIVAPEFGGSFIHPGTERRVMVELGYKF
ncbi:MAG: TonB-dependent receptor [Steroidobacteraceae bacterium]